MEELSHVFLGTLLINIILENYEGYCSKFINHDMRDNWVVEVIHVH